MSSFTEEMGKGFAIGAGFEVARVILPLIPLLVIGGGLYLWSKFAPEEATECENGQEQK